MSAQACPRWCSQHYIDALEGYPIHKHTVTQGSATVVIETAPEWTGPDDLPIWTHEAPAFDAAGARDLAAALLEAAQLLDGGDPR